MYKMYKNNRGLHPAQMVSGCIVICYEKTQTIKPGTRCTFIYDLCVLIIPDVTYKLRKGIK